MPAGPIGSRIRGVSQCTSRLASTPSRTVYYDGATAPFGETYAQTGTTDTSFTGQNQDTASTLYDFPAREYGQNQGRWPSPDPAGIAAVDPNYPQTWNRYPTGDPLPGGTSGGDNGQAPVPPAPPPPPPAPKNATPAKQPISPVVKLICQQQAMDFQAQYMAKSKMSIWASLFGGGAGAKTGYQSFISGWASAYAMFVGQRDTAYEIGYQACLAGGFSQLAAQ